MKVLDRYISRQYFQVFTLTMSCFVSLYLLIEFFDRASDFMNKGATASQYLFYFLGKTPAILIQIAPLSVLLTTFVILGRLSRSNELTAIFSCGISLRHIISIFLLATSLVCAALLLLENSLVPLGGKTANHIWTVELGDNKQTTVSQNRIWIREQGRFIQVGMADPESRSLQQIKLFMVDQEQRPIERIDALSARYSESGEWLGEDIAVHRFKPGSNEVEFHKLARMPIELHKSPEDFIQIRDNLSQEKSLFELFELIGKLKQEGFNTLRFECDLNQRFAAPFTCLVMAIFGIPFALRRGRDSSFALGISLSVAVGVIFHVANSALMAFGYAEVLPPIVAAWAGNILFTLLGLVMLLSIRH
ncbi:MAG TPA: LPS export ABC transporter permease LptG [Geothermobacteraceae bacterium]|nr:LPS export ABC transporter permease LptG [Geothermobacteraceae bacterium]